MGHLHAKVDVVPDYRLIIGGSMSLSFDNFAYRVVSVWEGIWALLVKTLVFPRLTNYMLTSFMFSLLN